MNRDLDRFDLLAAIVLAVSVFLWTLVWAYPYPHPNLWPFLATFGGRIPLTALAILGKLSLGVFAGLVYLVIRGAWIRYRDENDDEDDGFFTRFSPFCGALIFALSPFAWRSAQFLSPNFAWLVIAAFAVCLWQRGYGYRHLTLACLAYLLLAFVAGLHALGIVALAYVSACDVMRRWQSEQDHGQREEDEDAQRRRSIERTLSFVSGLVGFGFAIYFAGAYHSVETASEGLVAKVLDWWHGWFASALEIFGSPDIWALTVGCGLVAAFLALGRRLRAYGAAAHTLAITLSSALAIVMVGFALRSVDSDERVRLALMRDYVLMVLADSNGAEWLFTDGRFDDALRFEVKRRGIGIHVLNALTPPTPSEVTRLRALATEPGTAELFAAGGAEVFKAWARERPDRLATSAWQLGSPIVRRFDKARPRTYGTVMRADSEATKAGSGAADQRFAKMARDVLQVISHPSVLGSVFGGVDKALEQRFDALVWRAARMAGERADAAAGIGNTNLAEGERKTMHALDGVNVTLRALGGVIEQLLQTSNLVLTPKEALEVSLKRADFKLAQRYAREVLVTSAEDTKALFALGMANLEVGEYFNAARYLERVVRALPKEPAALNNLALAYLKLGKLTEAKETIEKAFAINPKSAEIKRNRAEIAKAMGEKM